MASGTVTLPVVGGGSGGGGISSINGDTTAAQTITAGTGISVASVGGTTTITNTSPSPALPLAIASGGTGQSNAQAALNNLTNAGGATNGDVLQYLTGNAQFAPFTAPPPVGDPNTFAYFEPGGALDSIPNWTLSASPIQSSMNADLTYNPNNLAANPTAHNFSLNVAPLQASPNDSANVLVLSSNLDSTQNGFSFGSAGRAVTLLAGSYNYAGNASTYGLLEYAAFSAVIGNGTDPVTIKGANYFNGAFTLAANATLDGSLRGFDFAPNFDAAAITTANVSVSGFRDIANMPVAIYGYDGFATTPLIGSIANNHNYVGFNSSPQITTLTGNAGCFGLTANPIVTTMGATSSVQFASFNPTITTMGATSNLVGFAVFGNVTTGHGNIYGYQFSPNVAGGDANATGAQINLSGVTSSGTLKGLSINTPTSTGVNNSAIDSQGFHRLSADYTISSGQGTVNYNNIGGQIVIPNATTVTGTDVFGNNMAFGINTGDATSDYTPAGLVSLTTLGFVGAISGDGTIHGAINFCLCGYAMSANTGTIDRINNFYGAAVPGGGTATVTESVLFLGDLPAGAFATNHWGIRMEHASLNNYVTNLAIQTADKKVTSDSLLGLGDQSLLSGDIHANIRNVRAKTDPTVYAVDAGYACLTSGTFTDDSTTAIVGLHNTAKVIVAATKTIGGLVGVFNPIGRADVGDDGIVPLALGFHTSFTSGNSATKNTALFASYFTGFHGIDNNAGQVTAMYDFYAQASSIAAGSVTTRYGLVVEADANYTKQNFLSGTVLVGGTAIAAPTAGNSLEVQGGQLAVVTAGNGLSVKEGANAKMGVATLVAGAVTVTTTAVTANSRIFITTQQPNGNFAAQCVTNVVAATSFDIQSNDAGDTSTIAWFIVEPA